MKVQQKISIVSNKLCPFAERACIAARQKSLKFQLIEVSLTQKQKYFTDIYLKAYGHTPNSNGKVPIFIHGDIILAQSDLISWYIAETFSTGNQLIPKNNFARFRMRHFCQFFCQKIIQCFYSFIGFSKKSVQEKEKIVIRSKKVFQQLNSIIQGPYVLGELFSLGDLMVYPWLERWVVIEKLFNVSIDLKNIKVINFRKTMQERQSVKQSMVKFEQYMNLLPFYKRYFKIEEPNL